MSERTALPIKANAWFFDLEIAFTEPCRHFVDHFGQKIEVVAPKSAP
jgi:hypothetical protein